MRNGISDESERPQLICDPVQILQTVRAARNRGARIGLVPTMGALHEGHLSLVRASRQMCDFTAVTIFVNPSQFGPGEDLNQYPRTLDADLAALKEEQVDVAFVPSQDRIYPPGFSTYVDPPRVAEPWEGKCRPGHFRGVTTIVLKLFQMIPADVAFFGQKDYQQALVIRHMLRDLNVPVSLEICPIIREPDGLAMSSRNRYLDIEERQRSLALHGSLLRASELAAEGESDPSRIRQEMLRILSDAAVAKVDYVALADPETLDAVEQVTSNTIALVAAYVGETRLIDNRRIG